MLQKLTDRIYIAGHRGMVGSALLRNLTAKGYSNIITKTSKELDLRNQAQVNAFFQSEKPKYVYMAAAKVGGIVANNTYRAEFLYDNLMIAANITEAAYRNGVDKMIFLGSSCIYPKFAAQPLTENSLLTGALEPTNEPYAIAKIAGIKLCETYMSQYGAKFISAMPTNLYGPNDNYNLQTSHVLPALIRKFHEAKVNHSDSVTLWGTGSPLREFMHVDDVAEACYVLMENYLGIQHVNVGTGVDIAIKDLANLIKDKTGFKGDLIWDTTKPDGTPRKLMDVSKLAQIGYTAKITLEEGIEKVYQDFLMNIERYCVD
jgi:GDP-L-fucose synthase